MPMGDKKNMRTAVMNKLAGDLAAAWPDPAQPVKLARSAFPLDRAEAYYVQDQMHHLLDQGLAGWKVGATSQKMRELDGHDDVIPGRIFATRSYLGPKHNLMISDFPNARVETEFAFRLIKAPVMRKAPWTAEELVPMMTLHPAIEIIGNRYAVEDASKAENSLLTIADNGGGMAFVFGNAVEDWQGTDFQHHPISLSVGGGNAAENFLGEMRCVPAEAVADLVNHLAARGHELAAGDFVSTGAATVPQPFVAGDSVMADFGSLGVIELQF
jgi:2-keto-4-pentenoate hydratase